MKYSTSIADSHRTTQPLWVYSLIFNNLKINLRKFSNFLGNFENYDSNFLTGFSNFHLKKDYKCNI